jgi:hypothetical protein
MTLHPMRWTTPLVVILVLASFALADCADGANCEVLRQNLYDQRKAWAACEVDADCIVLPGNGRDCTGVLACPFAVNRASRDDAELRMLGIGSESLKCHLCATPNCADGVTASCDRLSHRCLIDTQGFHPGSDAALPPLEHPDAGNGDADAL